MKPAEDRMITPYDIANLAVRFLRETHRRSKFTTLQQWEIMGIVEHHRASAAGIGHITTSVLRSSARSDCDRFVISTSGGLETWFVATRKGSSPTYGSRRDADSTP